jgi:hypothetical protein
MLGTDWTSTITAITTKNRTGLLAATPVAKRNTLSAFLEAELTLRTNYQLLCAAIHSFHHIILSGSTAHSFRLNRQFG